MKRIILFLSIAVLLSGCGTQMPNLTAQQSEQVAEYAVGLLMKYNTKHQSRLLNDEELARELERLELLEKQKAASREEQKQKPVDKGTDGAEETVVNNTAEPVVTGQYIEDFYGIEGIDIRYLDYEVADSYPNSGQELYFMMQASQGKKLLVLKFRAQNITSEERSMDMISIMPRFKVSVNGERAQYALSTLLAEDLANYQGTIAAGEAVELVLLAEISEEIAGNVTNISVSMQNGSQNETTLLN